MNGIQKINFNQNVMAFGSSKPKIKTKVVEDLPQKVEEGYNILRKYLVEADKEIIECEREIAETYPRNPMFHKLHDKMSVLKNYRESIEKHIKAIQRQRTPMPQSISDLVAKKTQKLQKLDEFYSKRFS